MKYAKKHNPVSIILSIVTFFSIVFLVHLLYKPYAANVVTERRETNKVYFRLMSHSFKGEIIGIKTEGDQLKRYIGCIIKLKLITSSTSEYDPRGEFDDYYCVIQRPYAEVLETARQGKGNDFAFKVGDIYYFDGKTDSVWIGRNNQWIDSWSATVTTLNYKTQRKYMTPMGEKMTANFYPIHIENPNEDEEKPLVELFVTIASVSCAIIFLVIGVLKKRYFKTPKKRNKIRNKL